MDRYRPYAKQREYHARTEREVLFSAGNQLGKTMAGAAEDAIHLTGRYPDWWEGRRFSGPITMLAGSESYELTRDGLQRLLLGPPADEAAWGTGMIPKDAIVAYTRRSGVSNAVDSVTIEHASGGRSTLLFKAYEQGRGKWQANTVDYVHFDEEPPEDVYMEGITRTNATGGLVRLSFTPLKGMSAVVRRFLSEESPDRAVVRMTIHDAEHYTPEERERIIASYPDWIREARTMGVPALGAGAIYPVAESDATVAPFAIPAFWRRGFALDVGWKATAAIWLAQDPMDGTLYAYSEYKAGQQLPIVHATGIKARGDWMRGAIDPAARGRGQRDGEQLMTDYQAAGLNLVPAVNAVEAGLYEVWSLLSTGRLKLFSTLVATLDEYRTYHRDEKGKIVKEHDHLMDALRYAVMTWDAIASVKAVEAAPGHAWQAADPRAGY